MLKFKLKRKNVWRNVALATSVILMLSLWIIGINRTSSTFLNEIKVNIDKKEGFKDLVKTKDIITIIDKDLPNDIRMQPLHTVDIAGLETYLERDTRIHEVEVFVDAHNNLNIEIKQRRPILRVMSDNGGQYYLDQQGRYIAQMNHRAVRVPVVTGYIEKLESNQKINKKMRLYDAYRLVNEINKNDFLSALIEQVSFKKGGRIIMIPKVGDEKIILDHMDDLATKLENLTEFYKEIARTNSWGKYEEIDISYRKQVVGRNPVTP